MALGRVPRAVVVCCGGVCAWSVVLSFIGRASLSRGESPYHPRSLCRKGSWLSSLRARLSPPTWDVGRGRGGSGEGGAEDARSHAHPACACCLARFLWLSLALNKIVIKYAPNTTTMRKSTNRRDIMKTRRRDRALPAHPELVLMRRAQQTDQASAAVAYGLHTSRNALHRARTSMHTVTSEGVFVSSEALVGQ